MDALVKDVTARGLSERRHFRRPTGLPRGGRVGWPLRRWWRCRAVARRSAWSRWRPGVRGPRWSSTDRGGTVEFVHDGFDGLLVDPEDTAALARAITRVLDDPELAARLADQGRVDRPELLLAQGRRALRGARCGRGRVTRVVFLSHSGADSGAEQCTVTYVARWPALGGPPRCSCSPSTGPSNAGPTLPAWSRWSWGSTPQRPRPDATSVGWARLAGGAWALVRHSSKVRGVLRDRSADVVVATTLKSLLFGLIGGRRAGATVVWSLHDRVALELTSRRSSSRCCATSFPGSWTA